MTAIETTTTHPTTTAEPADRRQAELGTFRAGESRGKATERESRDVAEQGRQKSWQGASFLKELFLGTLRRDLIEPYPDIRTDRPGFRAFYYDLATLLAETDSDAIDAEGEYPPELIDRLRKLGAFGMKIDRDYGGLGLSQLEYSKVMELLARHDGNLVALLSAHQSIGVPQPVKLFGTDDQKQRYLPRCAEGAISAFALTESDVGSDPARMATTARWDEDAGCYILDGEKLWITNGTFADLTVVMARHEENGKISAFIVEADQAGYEIGHRCRFMGLRALENGVIHLRGVRVPPENRIGGEGDGLKIALATLNTGRLALPAGCTGVAKTVLDMCERWCNERVQWGVPIGRHEAVGHMLADMAATTYAMESLSLLVNEMADRPGLDIRLEAAVAKEFNSVRGWRIVDDAVQIRGGRGYETAQSLAARGEDPEPLERIMRDFRINLIFEGTSEIMHLFTAREAVDKHLDKAGVLADPDAEFADVARALPGIVGFYAWWYPTRWIGWGAWPRFREYGELATHMRFVDRRTRKLSRALFHGMAVHRAGMERRQAFLFRTVDVATELMVMAAACSRSHTLAREGAPGATEAKELADLFCRGARRRIDAWLKALWSNDDRSKTAVARRTLEGAYADLYGAGPATGLRHHQRVTA